MKLLITILLVVSQSCLGARLENTYLPPGSASSAGGAGLQAPGKGFSSNGNFGSGGSTGGFSGRGSGNFGTGASGLGGFGPRPGGSTGFARPSDGPSFSGTGSGSSNFASGGSGGRQIPIISFDAQNGGDGNYRYTYETGNGIQVQEQGQSQGNTEAVSGSYSYTGPDGQLYSISYTADESGFHAQGAHIPTPPPIPPEIQRGIEQALVAEARGENQDGSYKGESSSGSGRYQGPGGYQGGSEYQSSQGGYKY